MPYPAELTLFIVVCVLLGVFVLLLLFYRPVQRFFRRHYTVRAYYRAIYRIAQDHDYYLINNFKSRTADSETFHIDHLLVGAKYIYCLRDRYYEGAISAKADDPTWILYHKGGSAYISNPMLRNQVRAERLSLITGIDPDVFISIVVINDDCYMAPFENTKDDSFLISLKGLAGLIKMLESRENVGTLDEWEVERVVNDFAALKKSEEA